MISITSSNEMIKKIKEDLKGIDKKPRQVMIEAVVTELKNQELASLGVDWSLFGESGGTTKSSNAKLSTGLLDTLNAFFSIGVIKPGFWGSLDLVADLRALIQDGDIEIKANPKVITTNGQPAEIYIAKEQYFSVVTGPLNYPYTRLEKVSVGIKLQITPFISEADEITVKIVPEVSDAIGYGREGLPVVDTRKVSTTVRVRDGQTITLGGLTQSSTREVQNKIPILGHIPILGYLFSHTKYEKVKTDIVIFITPRIKEEILQE
jgi:type II secretory pathway component GspD/PulD (secretin)